MSNTWKQMSDERRVCEAKMTSAFQWWKLRSNVIVKVSQKSAHGFFHMKTKMRKQCLII
jgi:hypothetical protein